MRHGGAQAGAFVSETAPFAKAAGVRLVDAGLIAYGRGFEHPCKIRLLKWLIRGLAAGRVEIEQPGGARLAIDPDDYIGWQILRTGLYEPASLGLAMRLMAAKPGLFVDVGANFGWYTCAVASVAGCRVLSIEPEPETCALLRANVARNGFRNVAVFSGAVGPQSTLLPMSRRAGGNSGTNAVGSDGDGGEVYWVASTPLDALLERLIHPPARPVLMKLDVEGFEPQALAGLDFDGPFRPRNLLLEYERAFCAQSWGSFEGLAAFFTQRGYELVDVTGASVAGDGPLPEQNVWARDRNQAP